MSDTAAKESRRRPFWASNLLLRTSVVVLMATAVPVASLIWASGVSRAEVERRALDGLASTAKATVLQEQQSWGDAVRVVRSAASRPVPLSAIQSRDVTLATQGMQNILETGPFAAVRIYDGTGLLVATAALPDVSPTPFGGTDDPDLSIGDPVSVGTRTVRQVSVVLGIGRGRLVVDLDLTQLLGEPSGLAFGRTGVKFLVTSTGLIVAGSSAVGRTLPSELNRAIVASGQAETAVIYSPLFGRPTAESYEPIPGQPGMGILVQQSRSEVMGGADDLAALLRWAAVFVGLLGAVVSVSLGVLLQRRTRRLAASERRLADSESESRSRLEQVLDAMPIGVFVAGPDGRSTYANREAVRVLGPGIVPGAAVDDRAGLPRAYVGGTDTPYPAKRTPLARALGGDATHVDDMEMRGPAGAVPVEVWGTPVLRGDGSVQLAITALADVSERRRATEQVQFLSAITAAMSEGVVLVRTDDSTIAYANGSYETMFGYEAGELVGRRLRDLTVPDFAASGVVSAFRQALQAEGTWRGDIHGLRKDGTSLWCAVNVTTLDHPTLGPTWIAVTTDITGRRQAQEDQARLASIVQASREAILGKTLDGVVTSWNHGAEVLFGYTAAEMIGGPIEVLIPPPGRDSEAELRARVARGLGVEHYESVRVRKDGTLVDVSATLSPIVAADGRIVGIATICRDVTERKRAQEALLEREEQLAAARDQALEASRLKSQFLANMSHEIRTPMNGVMGMAQLLLTGHLDPEQRRRVMQLHESGQSLLAIINDILDVSKMEAGKLELEVVDFDLLAAVESVVSLCSSPAAEKGLTLTRDAGPGVPGWVRGDSLRLRQILLNLLGNAVKFTEQGGVDLTISQVAPAMLRFTIRDTGIGIDASAAAHLLEPFSQADASTTRRFGGTGLGLAICRQLVELMGGALDFKSEPGVGSTFWFEIHLPAVEPRPATVASPPVNGFEKAPLGSVTGARILLVDDAEINREVGEGLLRSIGYEVDTVASGAEAVAAVPQGGYAAILMDCLMPVMDGYEATGRIRALEGPIGQMPIIALTAAAMSGDRERCLAAGMDDYVSKPLHLDSLRAALARCHAGVSSVRRLPPGAGATADGERGEVGETGEAALVDRLQLIRNTIPAEAFGQICQQFLSTTPDLIDRLRAAVGAADAGTALSLAHNLRGTMATVGAERLSALAQQVEDCVPIAYGALDDVIRQIYEEYDRSQAVVVSFLAADSGA
ncbi:MAG: hypothetical protein QOH36_2036 [Actinomycetota bacterium]|jgi:PAS domain S-box-containing protein|nr:hypothetical protein [Actinomycetota bacterium]MEA2972296.1 hypothetical protein [Actinomycetota bacterium]